MAHYKTGLDIRQFKGVYKCCIQTKMYGLYRKMTIMVIFLYNQYILFEYKVVWLSTTRLFGRHVISNSFIKRFSVLSANLTRCPKVVTLPKSSYLL